MYKYLQLRLEIVLSFPKCPIYSYVSFYCIQVSDNVCISDDCSLPHLYTNSNSVCPSVCIGTTLLESWISSIATRRNCFCPREVHRSGPRDLQGCTACAIVSKRVSLRVTLHSLFVLRTLSYSNYLGGYIGWLFLRYLDQKYQVV